MKSKTTTTTEEFNGDGTLKGRVVEVREEEDTGYIYPQTPSYYKWWEAIPPWQPYYSTTGNPQPSCEVTCQAE